MEIKNKRILELDYIRGFALLGILLTNIIALFTIPAPTNIEQAHYLRYIDFFVESKFFAIFSFLFGVGFFIFIRNAKSKDLNSTIVFLRRLFILAIFGIIHQFLHPGEALLFYAIIGLILIPCYYLNRYLNLILGLILLCVSLYIGNKTLLPVPYFILGLTAGQFNIFEQIKLKVLICLSIISGVLSGICWYFLSKNYVFPSYTFLESTSNKVNEQYIQAKELYNHTIIVTSPFISLFYVTVLLLILRINVFRIILSPLRYYGRMALTNYIGQTLLMWVIILLFNASLIKHTSTLYICICIYIIQFIFTYIWLKLFKFGPLEYIWRLGTYKKKFSIRY